MNKFRSPFVLLILLALLFASTLTTFAQDATPATSIVEPNPVLVELPAATAEATPPVIVPDVNVVINNPVPTTGNPASTNDDVLSKLLLAGLALWIIDKISGHFISMRLAALVPPDYRKPVEDAVETAEKRALEAAYRYTKSTADPTDDTYLTNGARIVGWKFTEHPDGSVTASRIEPVPDPGSAAPVPASAPAPILVTD